MKPLLSLFLLSSLLTLPQEVIAASPDNANPSEASAGDDILVVIDLPLAADLARESGLAEAEIAATIQIAQDAGVSAGEASEVLVQEADATEKRGVRPGLSHWLSLKWSSGVHGKKLADEIVDRPQTDTPSAEEQQKLQEQLKAQKKLALEQRKAQREQWKAMREKGAPPTLAGRKYHERFTKRLEKAKERLYRHATKHEDKRTQLEAQIAEIETKLATASGDEKAKLEAEKLRLQAEMTRHEGHDKAIENAQKQIEKAENRPQHGHAGDENAAEHPGSDKGNGPDDHASPNAHKKNKEKDKDKAPHGHPNGKDKDKNPNHKGGQDGNGGPKHGPANHKGPAKGQQ